MRWPWSRHEDRADEAVARAAAVSKSVDGRWPRINKVTRAADEQIRINHFAASIHRALEDHR